MLPENSYLIILILIEKRNHNNIFSIFFLSPRKQYLSLYQSYRSEIQVCIEFSSIYTKPKILIFIAKKKKLRVNDS